MYTIEEHLYVLILKTQGNFRMLQITQYILWKIIISNIHKYSFNSNFVFIYVNQLKAIEIDICTFALKIWNYLDWVPLGLNNNK